MYGYYAPSKSPKPGTVGTVLGTTGDPVYAGESRNMAVVSDWGQRLDFFRDGALSWSKIHTGTWLRGLDVFRGLIYYAVEDYVVVRAPKDGFQICQFYLPKVVGGERKKINSLRFSTVGTDVFLTVCYDFSGAGSVIVYRYIGGSFVSYYENPLYAASPRGAYFDGRLVVADTFGPAGDGLGSVYLVNPATGARITWTNVYYPNTVEPASSGRVLICAEHENRAYEWYPVTGARVMRMSAPHALFSTLSNTSTMIKSGEAATAGPMPPDPPKSACSVEHAGDWTLYSPNSARYGTSENEIAFADTDNNRVIVVRDGEMVVNVPGFNNPVNAVLIE